jgi:hypothetical protein
MALSDLLTGYRYFGVGSLPFREVGAALRFIEEHPLLLPFIPELPRRGAEEMMIAKSDRALDKAWDGYQVEEMAALMPALEAFKLNPPPLLKVQLCGPMTHARWSMELSGGGQDAVAPALHAAKRQAEWLVQVIRSSLGSKIMLVFDEPGLGMQQDSSPEEQSRAFETFRSFLKSVHGSDLYLGVHCCAPVPPEFFELPVDLYSFASVALGGLGSVGAAVLGRGSCLAVGCLPALDASAEEVAVSRTQFEDHEKTFAPLPGKLLCSASCGHAGASEEYVGSLY